MANAFDYIGWFLSIAAVAGNGFVIVLVAINRRLHSSANWFVLSLAVADFIVGFAIFPPAYLCNEKCNRNFVSAFFWFFLHSSVSNLCTLTWDRYTAIVHPLKYNTSLTKRRPGLVILTAWLIAFAISLSFLVGRYVTNPDTASRRVLHLTCVSAFDILSCALLFYAVVRILVVARAQTHQEAAIELQLQCNQSSMAREDTVSCRRRNKHTTAPFIIALVLFFLGCYVAVNSLILCMNFSCNLSEKAGHVVTTLLVLNSAVNPFVYAFLKKDIKREIAKLICKGK